jgi:hypothetical protein
MANHERHLLRQGFGRSHDQITLVLTVDVVDRDDELALRDRRDRAGDSVELDWHR